MKNKIPKVLEDSILMYKDFLEKYKDNEKPEKSIIELFYVKSIKEIAQKCKVDFYYKKYLDLENQVREKLDKEFGITFVK